VTDRRKGQIGLIFVTMIWGFRIRRECHIVGVFFPIPNIDAAVFVGIHTDGSIIFQSTEACWQKDVSERHRPRKYPLLGFPLSDCGIGLYNTFEERLSDSFQCRIGAVHRGTVFQKESDGPCYHRRVIIHQRHRRHFPERLSWDKFRRSADARLRAVLCPCRSSSQIGLYWVKIFTH
jgi:hypothetical protein